MLEVIGALTGFDLDAIRDGEFIKISMSRGAVVLPDRAVTMDASSLTVNVSPGCEKLRVYIIDPDAICGGKRHRDTTPLSVGVDTDFTASRGVYSGGLVVLGCVDVPDAGHQPLSDEKPLDARVVS